MINKLLKRAGIGFLIGMALGNIITIVLSIFNTGSVLFFEPALLSRLGNEVNVMMLQTSLSGLFGAICMATTVLYDIERWPLILASFVHYLIIILSYLPIAYILCWVMHLNEMLLMAGIFAAIYLAIWLIMNAIYKSQVTQLNNLQEQHQQKINEEKKS